MLEIRPLDTTAILLYLLGMSAMALYFSKRNTNTEEYFVGGRSFPGWAIGISLLGTTISSVSFLAFPAAAYALDWRLLVPNLCLPFVAILAIIVFIPFFRRAKLTSAFEYLEDRYGSVVRLYGTISYILLALLRVGKFLFLASIPLSLFSGLPMPTVILLLGIFVAFYTILGGIDAVIWSDVIQTIVLIVGGLICVGFIVWKLPGGIDQIFEVAGASNKFHLGSTNWNLSERTFWTVTLLGIFSWLTNYSADQNFIQRYAASRSTRDARMATATFSLLAVPTWTFFFLIGTCLFVFYSVLPDPHVAQLEADEVFPFFILSQIPAGLAGLIIAAVLAAAMSSLDSSINAVATLTVVDLIRPRFIKGRGDGFYLKAAKLVAILTSVIMILLAWLFSNMPKESMADLGWIVVSVFGGCLVGLFMLGFFSTKVDNQCVLVALPIAILLNFYLMLNTVGWLPQEWSVNIHAYWVGILVNIVFVCLAYGISLILGKPPGKQLEGLTIWTRENTRKIKTV